MVVGGLTHSHAHGTHTHTHTLLYAHTHQLKVRRPPAAFPRSSPRSRGLCGVDDGEVVPRAAVVGGVEPRARLVARLAEARLAEEEDAALGELSGGGRGGGGGGDG